MRRFCRTADISTRDSLSYKPETYQRRFRTDERNSKRLFRRILNNGYFVELIPNLQ
jgi:hypothetical protein